MPPNALPLEERLNEEGEDCLEKLEDELGRLTLADGEGRAPIFPVEGRAPTLPVEGRAPDIPVEAAGPLARAC